VIVVLLPFRTIEEPRHGGGRRRDLHDAAVGDHVFTEAFFREIAQAAGGPFRLANVAPRDHGAGRARLGLRWTQKSVQEIGESHANAFLNDVIGELKESYAGFAARGFA